MTFSSHHRQWHQQQTRNQSKPTKSPNQLKQQPATKPTMVSILAL
jgi:hypothetical protein